MLCHRLPFISQSYCRLIHVARRLGSPSLPITQNSAATRVLSRCYHSQCSSHLATGRIHQHADRALAVPHAAQRRPPAALHRVVHKAHHLLLLLPPPKHLFLLHSTMLAITSCCHAPCCQTISRCRPCCNIPQPACRGVPRRHADGALLAQCGYVAVAVHVQLGVHLQGGVPAMWLWLYMHVAIHDCRHTVGWQYGPWQYIVTRWQWQLQSQAQHALAYRLLISDQCHWLMVGCLAVTG